MVTYEFVYGHQWFRGIYWSLLQGTEDGDSMFLRNVGTQLPVYTAITSKTTI
jgi:hypothetical protein